MVSETGRARDTGVCAILSFTCLVLAGIAPIPCSASATPAVLTINARATMSETPTGSRPPSPHVPPVELQGVRYEQGRYYDRDGDQPGGYLVAIDIQTGQRLWRIKVYTVDVLRRAGAPVMASYFRSMRVGQDGKILIIENESGRIYHVDLLTQSSKQVAGPSETATESPKRSVPDVASVEAGGVRYEVLTSALLRGFKQRGGIIAAIDVTTDDEMWTLLVYRTSYDASEERDVQDQYITEITLSQDHKHLLIKDENKNVYSVDLNDRSIGSP
jgi:hypothetical protein